MKTILIVACLAAAVAANFTNYKVYQVTPVNKDELDLVKRYEETKGFDFWSKARAVDQPIDIMVAPEMQEEFTNALNAKNIAFIELIKNVEPIVQKERINTMISRMAGKGRINFDTYHSYAKISEYLDQLQKEHPDLVSVSTIGQTFQNRDLKMIKISTGGSNKPAILIDGGIHAREWIAPAMTLFTIHQLVENEANRNMIENVDWYIVPVLNPDGYEYTHSSPSKRFWRKTVSKGSYCDGVDANRNFDFHWMEVGASDYECSETYAGRKAFSESETRALKSVVEELGASIKLYLTFHSYGQYLLYPWGFTSDLPANAKELDSLAQKVNNAISAVRGTEYTIGSSTNVLYAAAGGSDDWVKGVGGVELAYTIELPGGGSNGFDPPASSIKRIVGETWEGVKVYHEYIDNQF